MFKFLWTRTASSAVQANNAEASSSSSACSSSNLGQSDDWVLLPTDYDDLMSQSISNLDLVSPSTMLPRSRQESSNSNSVTSTTVPPKSRRQLKYEQRKRQAQEQAERTPRYDPHMARVRDAEFKMAKMGRLGLRSGRVLASTSAGLGSGRGALTGAFAQQKIC